MTEEAEAAIKAVEMELDKKSWATVKRLARLGAAVEAMPPGSKLEHIKLYSHFVSPAVPWHYCEYGKDGYVAKETSGSAALEALTARS